MDSKYPTDDIVLRALREMIPRRAQRNKIDPETKLVDLGLDSIAKVALLFKIGLAIKVSPDEDNVEYGSMKTVGDVQQTARELAGGMTSSDRR